MLYYMLGIIGALLVGIVVTRRIDLRELNRMSRQHSEDLLHSNLRNYTIGWEDASRGVALDARYSKYRESPELPDVPPEPFVTYPSAEGFLEILQNAEEGRLTQDPVTKCLILETVTSATGRKEGSPWLVYGPDPQNLSFNYTRFMDEARRLMSMRAEERKKAKIHYIGLRT